MNQFIHGFVEFFKIYAFLTKQIFEHILFILGYISAGIFIVICFVSGCGLYKYIKMVIKK